MILLLDTSTPTCKLTLVDGSRRRSVAWEANRDLAKDLLAFLQTELERDSKTWHDLSGIGAFSGPGSFTGLRIGHTVLNTMADALEIPIVGALGEDWEREAEQRLQAGQNDEVILPVYGSDAHITKPRK